MPAYDILALIPNSPGAGQGVLRVPGSGDTYSLPSSVNLSANGLTLSFGASADVVLNRDAANALALRNGTAAQTFNIYNTFTNASNFERGVMRWAANVLEIGSEALGTGTARDLRLRSGSNTLTFNTGGNVLLGGTGWMLADRFFAPSGFRVNGNNGSFDVNAEVYWWRDASNVWAQRNGANAQETRFYGTFTDASNYRRVAVGMSLTGSGYIRPEGLGTGASGNTLTVSTGGTTVASLPSAASAGAGARLFVTDANATTFASIVAGGGSNGVPVYSDGTNWRIG